MLPHEGAAGMVIRISAKPAPAGSGHFESFSVVGAGTAVDNSIMRCGSVCVALLLTAGVGQGQRAVLQLPDPPQQGKPWRADAAVPTEILTAVEALFDQGFPDPRGCEYREIEVTTSTIWGESAMTRTRGWLLPQAGEATNRFAICWNGLIYPVAKFGPPADLRAEIASAGPARRRSFSLGAGETRTVIYSNALSTRLPLLLRCGETEAALRLASPFSQPNLAETPDASRDVYGEIAADWAWALFDRTLCAHNRGDEALALLSARQLAAVRPKIEAECARRGIRREPDLEPPRQGKGKAWLDFLEPLPQLAADLERRAAEPQRVGVLVRGLDNFPVQSERIAALIHDLDLVRARQWGQPGGVSLVEDPIVAALIQEGEAAVEPLLDCLENDTRLTRSIAFHRDFFRQRMVIPVSRAAGAALQAILQTRFSGGAPEIRAYWNRYRGLSLYERCYAILQDDAAAARWLEAATLITRPENETAFPGGFHIPQPAPTHAPVRLRGEPLRAKSNPSVSELLARRALEVPENNPGAYDLRAACEMAFRLAAWDLPAAGPVARTLVRRCCTTMKYSSQPLGACVARLTLVRARAGEERPFDDYAEWLKTTTPDRLRDSVSECLEPLRQFPENEVLRALIESLFRKTNSAWAAFPWDRSGSPAPPEPSRLKSR